MYSYDFFEKFQAILLPRFFLLVYLLKYSEDFFKTEDIVFK